MRYVNLSNILVYRLVSRKVKLYVKDLVQRESTLLFRSQYNIQFMPKTNLFPLQIGNTLANQLKNHFPAFQGMTKICCRLTYFLPAYIPISCSYELLAFLFPFLIKCRLANSWKDETPKYPTPFHLST